MLEKHSETIPDLLVIHKASIPVSTADPNLTKVLITLLTNVGTRLRNLEPLLGFLI